MIERIRTPDGGRFDRDHGPTPVEGYSRQGISGAIVIGRSGERMPSRSAAAEAEKKRRWRAGRSSCGEWMPLAGEHCARRPGHYPNDHRTRYAMDNATVRHNRRGGSSAA